MEPLTRQAGIVSDYFCFIEDLGRKLRSDCLEKKALNGGALLEAHPGLQALFDTLVSASDTPRRVKNRKIEEWNPLSQRILLSDERAIMASSIETDFSLITMYAQTFIEWAHEAAHILALEPWFDGSRRIISEEDFVTWYLAGEAFAYWYADIVVTRAIRETVPNADLVYTRSSVSNAGFHPEQAFRALGVTDAAPMLPIYVAAFLGAAPELRGDPHPLSAAYGKRIHEFYCDTTITLKSLYSILQRLDLFDAFQSRFCSPGGLPSLFGPNVVEEIATLGVPEFIIALGQRLLPALDGAPQDHLRIVAVRRHIQTRAYYTWCVRWSLQNGWVFDNGSLDRPDLAGRVGRYLDALEAALLALAAGRTAGEVLPLVAEADRFYEAAIRQVLADAYAHIRYRYWIFPFFEPTGGILGLWDKRTDYSLGEAEAVLRHVFQRSAWNPDLVEALGAFLGLKKEGRVDEARRMFNAFLTHPEALPNWSIALGAISPGKNRFREIAFEFH